jgi:PAS domain S-box-containing protein
VDITEVKNAERTRQNYESFYALFHGSPVPAMLTRHDDHVIMNVNVAFLDYLALGREAVIGHKSEEFNLNLDTGPNELSLVDKPVEDGNLHNFETELVLPSGETRSILRSVQHLYIQDTDAVLYTFVDITERVKAEMEIRRLNIERKTIEHKERHRIAQMLHDDLQQRLYAIKIYVNTLEENLQSGNRQSTQADFAETRKWLEEAIALTRQLGADLSPLKLRDGGLVEAILSISSQMKNQYGLEVELSAAEEFQTKLDDELQITLFQAVRELLFNVVKHSGSLKATVTLEPVRHDRVRIIVSDRGKGFDPKGILSEQNHSRGLRSIQQELLLFGGRLEVDSSEGRGTRMTINIPIVDSGFQS